MPIVTYVNFFDKQTVLYWENILSLVSSASQFSFSSKRWHFCSIVIHQLVLFCIFIFFCWNTCLCWPTLNKKHHEQNRCVYSPRFGIGWCWAFDCGCCRWRAKSWPQGAPVHDTSRNRSLFQGDTRWHVKNFSIWRLDATTRVSQILYFICHVAHVVLHVARVLDATMGCDNCWSSEHGIVFDTCVASGSIVLEQCQNFILLPFSRQVAFRA